MIIKNQIYTEKNRIELMETENLKLREDRVRKEFPWSSLQPLMKSLKLFGFLQPLQVNEKNEVIIGSRRLEAAKLAFIDKVPVIRTLDNNYGALQKEIFSDISTKHLSLREKAEAFQKIIQLTGMTKYALAKYFNLSHTTVCKTLAILNANKKTLGLIEEEKITEKKVAMVLYRLKDKSKENYVISEIIRKKLDIIQAGNLVAETNNPEIFKAHFISRLKALVTTIKNFKERAGKIDFDDKTNEEIKNGFNEVKKIIENEVY